MDPLIKSQLLYQLSYAPDTNKGWMAGYLGYLEPDAKRNNAEAGSGDLGRKMGCHGAPLGKMIVPK